MLRRHGPFWGVSDMRHGFLQDSDMGQIVNFECLIFLYILGFGHSHTPLYLEKYCGELKKSK